MYRHELVAIKCTVTPKGQLPALFTIRCSCDQSLRDVTSRTALEWWKDHLGEVLTERGAQPTTTQRPKVAR